MMSFLYSYRLNPHFRTSHFIHGTLLNNSTFMAHLSKQPYLHDHTWSYTDVIQCLWQWATNFPRIGSNWFNMVSPTNCRTFTPGKWSRLHTEHKKKLLQHGSHPRIMPSSLFFSLESVHSRNHLRSLGLSRHKNKSDGDDDDDDDDDDDRKSCRMLQHQKNTSLQCPSLPPAPLRHH